MPPRCRKKIEREIKKMPVKKKNKIAGSRLFLKMFDREIVFIILSTNGYFLTIFGWIEERVKEIAARKLINMHVYVLNGRKYSYVQILE